MPNVGQHGAFLRKVIDAVRTQDYPYDPTAPKKVDWRAYDVAQANEVADMLAMIRVTVDVAARRLEGRGRRRGRGQPPVPAEDVAKVLLMQAYFGVPNRVAEGFARLFEGTLGLSRPFGYKTIERGYDRGEVNALLDEALALTNLPVRDLERAFAIDGSGSPTRKRKNYADAREAQRRKGGGSSARFPAAPHDFVYHVFVVGAAFKLIAAWRSTARHDVGETSFFPDLMRETKALHHPNMEMAVGDGAYAGRPQCNVARDLGVTARFLPKRNVTLKRLGSDEWIAMLLALIEDPQKWLSEYYQREASESANSVIANDNPHPLRKRLAPRKCTEDRLRGLSYNLKRLCYLYYLLGLSGKSVILAAAS